MLTLTSHESVDGLSIIITNRNVKQIIHVPTLENGTGKAQGKAFIDVFCDWGLKEIVKTCRFVITAMKTS